MARSTCVVVVPLLLVLGLLAAPWAVRAEQGASDRFQAIEQLRVGQQITDDEALLYKIWSVRNDPRLPADIRALPAPDVGCATPYMVDLFQRRQRGQLSPEVEAEAKQVWRPSSVGYYDSSTYPIRSHYTAANLSSKAAKILQYAEYSWSFQVGTVGFPAPVGDYGGSTQGGSTALDIYVGDASGAGGYTSPEMDWTDTLRTDCTTWVMISRDIPDGGNLQTTVAHEFNHVLQAVNDCTEWIAFWENTATYMMELTYDSVNDYIYFMPEFQMNPGFPFEYFDAGGAYQYGGVVVALTIDEAIGNGDGQALRKVWDECRQTDWDNEPDFFDAIEIVAPQYGHGDMDDFQYLLTEWRYVAGTRDDGRHFSEGGDWPQVCQRHCDVVEDRQLRFSDLPVSSVAQNPLYGHGSSYVAIDMEEPRSGNFLVQFEGDDSTRWGLNLICRGGGPTQTNRIQVSPSGSANEPVAVANVDSCTLAVSNLGPPGYDPDDDFGSLVQHTQSYSYTLDFVAGSVCICDKTFGCDPNCACDPECTCACDTTNECDEDCDCDPECEGCNCAATAALPLTGALGILSLLLAGRRRRR